MFKVVGLSNGKVVSKSFKLLRDAVAFIRCNDPLSTLNIQRSNKTWLTPEEMAYRLKNCR